MPTSVLRLRPLSHNFGAIASGTPLLSRDELPSHLRDVVIAALRKHRILIFKGCGDLTADRQIEISRWFGPLESTFTKHARSPHTDIFRVSNDSEEGCTQVGRSGWHIDGTFVSAPFTVQTMHMVRAIEGGDTLFAPLSEVVESLTQDVRTRLAKLWYVASSPGGRSASHPLLVKHPVTSAPAMCFHCGENFFGGFSNGDPGSSSNNTLLSRGDGLGVLQHITECCDRHAVRVAWEDGDFAIVDNVACAHYATVATQADPQTSGLRILHRTSVAGDVVPEPLDLVAVGE